MGKSQIETAMGVSETAYEPGPGFQASGPAGTKKPARGGLGGDQRRSFSESVPNPAFPFTGNSSGVKNLSDFWHHFVLWHIA